jgi:hypothetical protein
VSRGRQEDNPDTYLQAGAPPIKDIWTRVEAEAVPTCLACSRVQDGLVAHCTKCGGSVLMMEAL